MTQLVLAQPFVKRLGTLPNADQKLVRDAVMQLYLDVTVDGTPRPGLRWHALNSADLYSVSPNMDYRVIVYHRGQDYMILYADHHDRAYDWAERRRLEVHPYTGAMQVVELDERTEVQVISVQEERPFGSFGAEYLLQLGVPERLVQTVRHASTVNAHELLELLPEEVAERLVSLLSGELVTPPEPVRGDPFRHPDAQRLFVVAEDESALKRALSGSWQEWMVFLHPSQRRVVDRSFSGPARLTGGAGTGKTVVALHRAARLARAGGRVLLTTYTRSLVQRLEQLIGSLALPQDARARISVVTVHALARSMESELRLPKREPDDSAESLRARFQQAADQLGSALTADFLLAEWRGVIEGQGLRDWEAYRDVRRTGRGTPLSLRGRQEVWRVTQAARAALETEGRFTWRSLCDAVTDRLEAEQRAGIMSRFDHVIADEAQDLGPSEVRFLLALVGDRPDHLLLAMDEGQRIFQRAFPLRSLGLNFQGRSARLKLNYRTSRQIRELADRLLPGTLRDADEAVEQRLTLSRFQGPDPEIVGLTDEEAEYAHLAGWLRARLDDGVRPEEIAVFTRHDLETTSARVRAISGQAAGDAPGVSISTMHGAKGLEYRAVAVVGLTDRALPSVKRLAELTDPGDQEDFIAQERHLLYVAATRARDRLLLTYSGEASRFLTPLVGRG